METTAAFDGLRCTACGAAHATTAGGRCPDCAGPLVAEYDRESLAAGIERETLAERRFDGQRRYGDLLPFPAAVIPSMNEGTTPLIACPDLADEWNVGAVYVKDEGANPTGTTADRGLAIAVAAAREFGADGVALPTTGDAGQSAAAYATRAGLQSRAFVPSRSTFVTKAMTNVHGGEMTVVEGRYGDAVDSFEEAMGAINTVAPGDGDTAREPDWYSIAPFDTPYRQEGAKTLLFEVVEQLDWTVPDHVVHPTGHGIGVVGSHRAATQLRRTGLVEHAPALHVAQPAACAPIVTADDAGDDEPAAWERPDTLVGALEVPDPAGGALALDAVRETGGWAIDVDDDAALDAAVELAGEGVGASATGGVGVAAGAELADGGHIGSDDTVVLVNPVAGNKENDVLRSHLMRKGV